MTSEDFGKLSQKEQQAWVLEQLASGKSRDDLSRQLQIHPTFITGMRLGRYHFRYRTMEQRIADQKSFYKKLGKILTDEEAREMIESDYK